jgi:predicted DNA-binding transcriptional regulator AlpA
MTKSKKSPPQRQHHLDQRADLIISQGTIDGDDDLLLTTPQCALWLGVSIQFLEIGRSKNYGPPHVQLAPRVIRYRKDEVNKWLRERSAANIAARRAKQGEG